MSLRFSVSPGALILGGLIFYLADGRTLRLLLLPVLVHELGHLAAMYLLGQRLSELRIELSGLCLRYAVTAAVWQDAIIALAGPAAGLAYALLVRQMGDNGALSAGISLLLSFFNLLPAMPLDGWHVASAILGERRAARLSLVTAGLVWLAGLLCILRGYGAALLLAGCFLLLARLRLSREFTVAARTNRRCG